jgi:hypothetical protein
MSLVKTALAPKPLKPEHKGALHEYLNIPAGEKSQQNFYKVS